MSQLLPLTGTNALTSWLEEVATELSVGGALQRPFSGDSSWSLPTTTRTNLNFYWRLAVPVRIKEGPQCSVLLIRFHQLKRITSHCIARLN